MPSLGLGGKSGSIILPIRGDLADIDRLNLLQLLGEVHAPEEGLETGVLLGGRPISSDPGAHSLRPRPLRLGRR